MKDLTTSAIQLHSSAIEKRQAQIIVIHKRDDTNNSQATPQKALNKLFLNTSEGSIIISISDILRLESSSNYTCLYTLDSKKYVFSKTMKTLIDQLPSDQFIRCHNSHFVNIDQIVSLKKGSLFLKSNIEIPIARQKYQDVVSSIKSKCISF